MEARRPRGYRVAEARGARHPIASRVPGPYAVRFLDETDEGYLVGEPGGVRQVWVPKERATQEFFPPQRGGKARGRLLVRWSTWALVAAAFGGAGGVLLGSAVALVAFARLTRFTRRVRRWERIRARGDEAAQLPVEATAEYLRLRAGLGQGLLAVLIGCFVFLMLLGRL